MQKRILVIMSSCIIFLGLKAQDISVDEILRQIDRNNKELSGMTALIQSKQADLYTTNNIPATEIGGYYLPLGTHNTGNYSELQLSQSFKFPTVYQARKDLIDQQEIKLQLDYQIKRQEILLTAKQLCFDIIFTNQRIAIQQDRSIKAQIVFDQISELHRKEEISLLELNKAKVFWLQQQFKVQQLESDKLSMLLLLKNLNGGMSLSIDQIEYNADLHLNDKDTIWLDILESDPLPKQLRQEEVVASYQLKLQREMKKPDLTAGLNYQGVNGANYTGIYAGISLPIWSHKGKIEAAQQNLKFRETRSVWKIEEVHADFEKQYNDYQALLPKFAEYQSTLGALQSDALLMRAYEVGQISFLEYYMELSFYREAQDALIQFEHQLHQLQNEILKHELLNN
ncbi:MAG: TolC family protein [Saprospiraceae bacterium]|nr:TolC family protein [Saprospiraceae bacterium]